MYINRSRIQTFMPISIGDMSANGTSRVDSSHSTIAYDHMSADLTFMSSPRRCSATTQYTVRQPQLPHQPSLEV